MRIKHFSTTWGFLTALSGIITANSQNDKVSNIKRLNEEVGCIHDEGSNLGNGVYLPRSYQKYEPPEGNVSVYVCIVRPKVLKVDKNPQTVTIDLLHFLMWEDLRIKRNFTAADNVNDGIKFIFEVTQLPLWTPYYHIPNLSEWKSAYHPLNIVIVNIVPYDPFLTRNSTFVQKIGNGRCTIFCDFDHSRFPMDEQKCPFRFASMSRNLKLLLFDPLNIYNSTANNKYQADGFDITITFINGSLTNNDTNIDSIGFDIHMKRIFQPYLFQYYLPCIATVVTSQISFIIPLSAIPGRIALVVTLFLSLTNIFVHFMVKYF